MKTRMRWTAEKETDHGLMYVEVIDANEFDRINEGINLLMTGKYVVVSKDYLDTCLNTIKSQSDQIDNLKNLKGGMVLG